MVVGDLDVDLAARRGELEGIGEYVEDYLVEILPVDPYRQLVGVVLETERYLLRLGLMLEHVVDILGKCDEVSLLHPHLHHALINLTEVHHLVDQVEDALCIALDGEIDIMSLGIAVLFHQ